MQMIMYSLEGIKKSLNIYSTEVRLCQTFLTYDGLNLETGSLHMKDQQQLTEGGRDQRAGRQNPKPSPHSSSNYKATTELQALCLQSWGKN